MQHEPDRESGSTFVELFFDLVFVYAITQLAGFIHAGHDAEAFLRAALIFAMVWWVWEQFTWAGNGVEVSGPVATVAMLAATGAAFFMAQGVPDAFTGDGEWFSLPFAIAMGIGLSLYWLGLRHEREHQRALVSYLPLTCAGVVMAGAGGFTPDGVQPWMYLSSFLLFVGAGWAAQFGTPFHVYPRHFAERHALIVTVALGESIIAVGVGAGGLERSPDFAFAVLAGFTAVAVLWWSYFAWFRGSTEHFMRLREPHNRAAFARDIYAWAHLPIVFGVVLVAVAAESVIARPGEPLEDVSRTGLATGTALFQLGIVAAHWRASREVLVERALGAGVAVALVAVLPEGNALPLMLGATGAIAAALAAERARHPQLVVRATAGESH